MNKEDFEITVKELSNAYKIINNYFIKIVIYLYENNILNDDYLIQLQECCEMSNEPKSFIEFVNNPPKEAHQGNTYDVDYIINQYHRDNISKQQNSK